MNITKRITDMRVKRGWSEYEFAQRARLPQSTISSWHRKNSTPTLETLKKIADTFGISIIELISDESETAVTDADDIELIKKYRSLMPSERRIVNAYMMGMCGK